LGKVVVASSPRVALSARPWFRRLGVSLVKSARFVHNVALPFAVLWILLALSYLAHLFPLPFSLAVLISKYLQNYGYKVISKVIYILNFIVKCSYRKKQWRPICKKRERGKNLSPRNRKACHSVSTEFEY
jgi:hypothetical protein